MSKLKVFPLPRESHVPRIFDPPRYETLSADQREVYDTILPWIFSPHKQRQWLSLGGLAGTGKSTIVAVLADELMRQGLNVVFTAFTGKAVDVLARKLATYGIHAECCTLHSMLYTPQLDERECITGWNKKYDPTGGWDPTAAEPPDLIVVDEASMLNRTMWEDLLEIGAPILAVGDHGQLPPVGGEMLSLLNPPDLVLEKIHRQAEDNPILALAHHVRRGGSLGNFHGPWTTDDGLSGVFPVYDFEQVVDYLAWDFDAAGICYFNNTRVELNHLVRQRRGFVGPDFVICLRNAQRTVFNGMRGILRDCVPKEPLERTKADAVIDFPDHDMRVVAEIQLGQFGRARTIDDLTDPQFSWAEKLSWLGLLFDFGYIMTCHKSQGSQWRTVALKPEVSYRDEMEARARWLYTAVSRASERLILVGKI